MHVHIAPPAFSQDASPLRRRQPGCPIFIHGLPRVGSTWFSYKFDGRQDIGFRFEPFHENLIAGSHECLQTAYERLRHGDSLRHPHREMHYHKDYKFQRNGGVALFKKRFCYQNYYMDHDDEDEDLKAYLDSQIREASKSNKTPCIKSTKSVLRASWLKHNRPGHHLYLFRNPRLIDNSNFSYRGFFSPYIRDYALIVGQNGSHPVLSEIAEWSGLDCFISDSLEEEQRFYRRQIADRCNGRYGRQFHFDCLCFFWCVGLALATRYSDLIVDMDALDRDEVRLFTEEKIRAITGVGIDLSDYHRDETRVRRVFRRHQMEVSRTMCNIIQNALSQIEPDWGILSGVPRGTETGRSTRLGWPLDPKPPFGPPHEAPH